MEYFSVFVPQPAIATLCKSMEQSSMHNRIFFFMHIPSELSDFALQSEYASAGRLWAFSLACALECPPSSSWIQASLGRLWAFSLCLREYYTLLDSACATFSFINFTHLKYAMEPSTCNANFLQSPVIPVHCPHPR